MNNYECNGKLHVIKSGESLYRLSIMYGVPLAMILRANPYIDIYNLRVGETVCIPMMNQEYDMGLMPYEVKEEDTILDILEQFNIDFDELLEYNDIANMMLKPGITLQIPMYNNMEER